MITTTKNQKRNDRFEKQLFLKKIFFFQNDRFFKLVVSLTVVKDNLSLKIVNDDPSLRSLTKRGNRPEGHLYSSLSSF